MREWSCAVCTFLHANWHALYLTAAGRVLSMLELWAGQGTHPPTSLFATLMRAPAVSLEAPPESSPLQGGALYS